MINNKTSTPVAQHKSHTIDQQEETHIRSMGNSVGGMVRYRYKRGTSLYSRTRREAGPAQDVALASEPGELSRWERVLYYFQTGGRAEAEQKRYQPATPPIQRRDASQSAHQSRSQEVLQNGCAIVCPPAMRASACPRFSEGARDTLNV